MNYSLLKYRRENLVDETNIVHFWFMGFMSLHERMLCAENINKQKFLTNMFYACLSIPLTSFLSMT